MAEPTAGPNQLSSSDSNDDDTVDDDTGDDHVTADEGIIYIHSAVVQACVHIEMMCSYTVDIDALKQSFANMKPPSVPAGT